MTNKNPCTPCSKKEKVCLDRAADAATYKLVASLQLIGWPHAINFSSELSSSSLQLSLCSQSHSPETCLERPW